METTKPKVSIIVVNWNGLSKLGNIFIACLRSVLSLDYEGYEVIFVDNASTDGSVEVIRTIFKEYLDSGRLRIIKLRKNVGLATGYNVGALLSKGDYLVFMNNDVIVARNFLKRIIVILEALRKHRIVVAQGKVLRLKEHRIIDCAGDVLGRYAQCWVRGFGEPDEGQYDKYSEIFGPEGMLYVIRRDAFLEVGGFDNDFFVYSEDDDLSWRLRLRGYRALYIPFATAYHLRGGSGYSLFVAFHNVKNLLALSIKNHFKISWHVATLLFVVLKVLSSLRRREGRVALAQLRGCFWAIKNLKRLIIKRRLIQALATPEGKKRILMLVRSSHKPF